MLFTVVIPVFNSSDCILDTLKSVRAASNSLDYEIILIDDCSKDIDKLKKILQDFDEVKLIEKDEKTNAANSRNIGISKSKGRYVFLLDSDDQFIANSIDKRIKYHKQNDKGIVFGNFITKINSNKIKSNLPSYDNENMRDYILVERGDFRSSVLSIDKNHYRKTLFDTNSKKHQDWIFAFKCWDHSEKIGFDEKYMTTIIVDGNTRMSSSLNVEASRYFCDKYLKDIKYINFFSKNNWNSMISNLDQDASNFFLSIYKPQNISDYVRLKFYQLLASKTVIPYSSSIIVNIRKIKSEYENDTSI